MTNVVKFVYDEFTADIQAQVVRDLLILRGSWELEVNDNGQFPRDVLDLLNVGLTTAPPTLVVVYKTGDEWPQVDPSLDGIPRVDRDMKPDPGKVHLDPNPRVGYFLRPQAKGYTNRTQTYLNRRYPQGKGNPWVNLVWG